MLLWGITHAALSKYQEKERAISEACRAERAKMTPQQQKQLQCGTPEVSLVSRTVVKPGETGEVALNGKFPAGTKFIFQSDSIEVLKESSNVNSYRATIRAVAGGGPRVVSVSALIPVCCRTAYVSRAVYIGGSYSLDLQAANGWKVKGQALPMDMSRSTDQTYLLEFFRANETKPFAKRKATFYPAESDSAGISLSISGEDETSMNAQQQMENLTKQLQNPNISDAERDKLMKKMEEVMTQMTKNIGDPSYLKKLQAQEEEFGCRGIHLTMQNGAVTGNMNCSQKAGNNISLTGAMKLMP